MQIRVRYFAVLREITGQIDETFNLDEGSDIARLLDLVEQRYPALHGLTGRLAVALHHAYATPQTPLFPGAEVALIPPVSGGSGAPPPTSPLSPPPLDLASQDGRFRLTSSPLELSDVIDRVHAEGHGAIVSFVGTIRKRSHDREVLRLEYEAYPEMALSELENVAAFVCQRWPLATVAIHHRIGSLAVGETAVVLAVSTPHRQDGFAAASACIDRLKQTVPIWKKEIFTDGSSWVGWGP